MDVQYFNRSKVEGNVGFMPDKTSVESLSTST